MTLVASPAGEQGYIRTVLSREHFMDMDSSTLALPSEEMLKVGRQDLEKSMRIQHQVQMTMAKRTTKKSLANGSIYQSVSISDQVPYTTLSQREVFRTPSKSIDTMKDHQSSAYENGWGGGYSQYGQRRQENGWAGGYSTYSQRGTEKDSNQRKPFARKEVSPEREVGMGIYEQRKNTAASLRYPEHRQYNMSTTRYSRSEFGTAAKARQSTTGRSNMSDQDSVFNSGPNSPSKAIYQQRNSRSLNNLLDKENYQAAYMAGSSQVRAVIPPQQMYSRPEVHRATYQKTVYRTGRGEYSGATGMTMGGKRTTMTAGRVAAGPIMQTQVDGVHAEGPVGSAAIQVTSEVDMTLERAVSLLQSDSSSAYWLVTACNFIQHECFQKIEARRRVYTLGGIPRLIRLLNSDNEELQRAACAALRNLVFEDNDNKLEVCEQRGMPILLTLLRDTQDLEIKRQITGLLWNLSSNDQLKIMLIRDALSTLNKSIIIPCSGWKEGEYSKNDMMNDVDIFYNATGCLRNMSSAGPEGRQAMRDCDGLIDSLVHYVRKSIADYKPDDRATENCVCILHNLSYQLESELPGQYSKYFYVQNRDHVANETNIGCFGGRSRKVKEWGETPVAEEISNPRGVEWLWNSIVVRMYLSLIAKSSRNYTQEAALGSLQNLTAGNGSMPFSVAQMVVQKESGLQHVRNMLFASEPGVKRTSVSLLRNLSRNSSLHNDISTEMMPDLVRALPDSVPDSNIANDTAASLCYVLNSLISSSSQNARLLLQNGGVRKLINLSSKDGAMGTKAGKAASLVLYNMWTHQELHNAYKKATFKKGDFVNPKTSKAYHSL
ncbi:PREDICTED: plakophilin-2 isoform X2 [Nanorana parkeri]|uniref:plakophilin-2 isoform X2 n=1 Tax=Nanorana parkeri TaxID=125878 RepID=UPI000854DB95|nr:PREDICTED: plakophilin-2 isoform X2 [Nanorana parkeri]